VVPSSVPAETLLHALPVIMVTSSVLAKTMFHAWIQLRQLGAAHMDRSQQCRLKVLEKKYRVILKSFEVTGKVIHISYEEKLRRRKISKKEKLLDDRTFQKRKGHKLAACTRMRIRIPRFDS
jgi:hypothetical protein